MVGTVIALTLSWAQSAAHPAQQIGHRLKFHPNMQVTLLPYLRTRNRPEIPPDLGWLLPMVLPGDPVPIL
jgi:hypothetical protein